MKARRFSEEQVIGVLKEGEAGVAVKEICREQGICEQTYYRWKSKFGGLAGERRRYGYRRLTVLLRRGGWAVNHKRIGAAERQPLARPTRTIGGQWILFRTA